MRGMNAEVRRESRGCWVLRQTYDEVNVCSIQPHSPHLMYHTRMCGEENKRRSQWKTIQRFIPVKPCESRSSNTCIMLLLTG